jgi:hypothetical protein
MSSRRAKYSAMGDSDSNFGGGGGPSSSAIPGVLAGNIGNPIMLSDVQVDGVAADHARFGEIAKIWTRLAITSDDPAYRALEHPT